MLTVYPFAEEFLFANIKIIHVILRLFIHDQSICRKFDDERNKFAWIREIEYNYNNDKFFTWNLVDQVTCNGSSWNQQVKT